MHITVRYMAQLRQATGVTAEEIDIDAGRTVRDVIQNIAERRGEVVKRILLDSNGIPQPSLLVFVNDQQVPVESPALLTDREVLTLLTPMAGG